MALSQDLYGRWSGVADDPWPSAQSGYQPSTTSNAYNLPSDTARSNLAASPYNVQLADLVNATNRAAQTAANASRLGPQGQATQTAALTNAQRSIQGLLDPETEQMLRAGIAEGGAAAGMGVDSPRLASAYRRATGQTIAGTEASGLQQYLALLAANPAAPIYSPASGLISPGQYASVASAQDAATRTGSGAAPRVSFPSGGGGGGGYTPSAAEYNSASGGGGGYDYSNPFVAAGGGTPLVWTSASAEDLGLGDIGSPAYGGGMSQGEWDIANELGF